ncbi:hypothetical protein HDIA_1374 [Hartmannibacter diazotrophicus]|uniref:Uncharacterized protein n=1 Tax=Hartmannibacter diazotrophicus TaxID=1482074 RepID=A0A2C9D5W6_9HYPH|nr:hypothetical protein [Hartmannibacter diazotrophicus]SON54915.1 hypothetical protein HDIA_1374 [Hartmannibacter diazotrophicus]
MELSLPVILGAVIGLGVGLLDYGIVASILRREFVKRETKKGSPVLSRQNQDMLFKVLFVVNAIAFAALGAITGNSLAGYGVQ